MQITHPLLAILVLALWLHPEAGQGAKILALFPYPLKSHFIMFDALLVELAKRGHQVTVVNTFPKKQPLPNYTDIDVSSCFQLPSLRFEIERAFSYHSSLLRDLFSYVEAYDDILACEPMRQLLYHTHASLSSEDDANRHHPPAPYDLVITEIFSSDAMLGFVHHFGVPFISFCSTPLLTWASDRVGTPDNPSYISFSYNDKPLDAPHSTFFQRAYNTYAYLLSRIKYRFFSETKTDLIVRKHFGPHTPSLDQIAKNTSLIFTFSHFSINAAKPMVPGVIEVGGIQINKPSPLPSDIKKFMDEADDGVIYFCLGSLLQAKTMPAEKRNAFLKAFAQIPQRVLWKYEEDDLPGKTDNIMIRKWMPQRDILAHPKVRLFIAHGGALGLNEAVYEGVPILGIPFWVDQTLNIKSVEAAGVAEMLEYPQITATAVLSKIRRILDDDRYKEKAEHLKAIYRDRPQSAMETAVYWTEYVIRHKGASHLRTAAVHLPWYQYLLLDVIAFLFLDLVAAVLVLKILYTTIKIIIVNTWLRLGSITSVGGGGVRTAT